MIKKTMQTHNENILTHIHIYRDNVIWLYKRNINAYAHIYILDAFTHVPMYTPVHKVFDDYQSK